MVHANVAVAHECSRFISLCPLLGSQTCLFQDMPLNLSRFGRYNVHLQSSPVFSEAAVFL